MPGKEDKENTEEERVKERGASFRGLMIQEAFPYPVAQCLSTFLMLQRLNIVPHVAVPSTIELFSLLHHSCK